MSSHIGDANKKALATVGGIVIDAELVEPGMGIAEFRPFAERQLIASTPAAPGIDLEQFRELHKQLLSEAEIAEVNELEADSIGLKETANRQALRSKILSNIAVRLGALIDASPKGGSDASEEVEEVAACLGDDAAAMLDENPEDERALNMQRAAELLTAMQATSAEVGS